MTDLRDLEIRVERLAASLRIMKIVCACLVAAFVAALLIGPTGAAGTFDGRAFNLVGGDGKSYGSMEFAWDTTNKEAIAHFSLQSNDGKRTVALHPDGLTFRVDGKVVNSIKAQ